MSLTPYGRGDFTRARDDMPPLLDAERCGPARPALIDRLERALAHLAANR